MIILVGCGKVKRPGKHQADRLYLGPYFSACLRLARWLAPDDRIRILSAKHGVVRLDEELEQYDVSLIGMSREQRQRWAASVAEAIKDLGRPVYLCGSVYHEFLPDGCRPLPKVGIGAQLGFIRSVLDSNQGGFGLC